MLVMVRSGLACLVLPSAWLVQLMVHFARVVEDRLLLPPALSCLRYLVEDQIGEGDNLKSTCDL